MYIPEHQYIIKQLVTTEGRFQYESGQPFSGTEYVEFSNGDKYDVPKSDIANGDFRKAKKLFAPTDLLNFALLLDFSKIYLPTRPENKLSIPRYFAKNKVSNQIVEIDYSTYSRAIPFSRTTHIEVGTLTWFITGPPYDTNTLDIFEEGTISKNKREVDTLNKSMTGIDTYVTDFTFLSDPNYSQMVDPQENTITIQLPSPS
jgi:hypothetical protein